MGFLAIPIFAVSFLVYSIESGKFAFMGTADTIAILGEGKYEIGKFSNRIALEDRRNNNLNLKILVGNIEKYLIQDTSIYIIGDYGEGSMKKHDGTIIKSLDYIDYETGEYKTYKEDELIPHYVILDYKKDELRKYIDWEDIPEADRAIFEKLQKEVQ